jgi:hypothetical protein
MFLATWSVGTLLNVAFRLEGGKQIWLVVRERLSTMPRTSWD